jgi:hypothetical protein
MPCYGYRQQHALSTFVAHFSRGGEMRGSGNGGNLVAALPFTRAPWMREQEKKSGASDASRGSIPIHTALDLVSIKSQTTHKPKTTKVETTKTLAGAVLYKMQEFHRQWIK